MPSVTFCGPEHWGLRVKLGLVSLRKRNSAGMYKGYTLPKSLTRDTNSWFKLMWLWHGEHKLQIRGCASKYKLTKGTLKLQDGECRKTSGVNVRCKEFSH